MTSKEQTPEWVAEVYPDWTTLQILELGIAFAFNRETGRIYKLPSGECPFQQCCCPNNQGNSAAESRPTEPKA